MLTIHLMEAHEFNPIESVSYKAELADSLTNDTSAAQGMCLNFPAKFFGPNWTAVKHTPIFARYLGDPFIYVFFDRHFHLKTYT